jgi:Thioredoxin-like
MIALSFAFVLAAPLKYETLIFVTSDCPIARRYTPELKRIMKDFSQVSTFMYVYEDEDARLPKMKAHHREYQLSCPMTLDPKHVLARQYSIKGVPTVLVRTGKGSVQYQGRIDDSYGADFKWRPVKHADLRNALTALKQGKPVLVKSTKVIGCALNQ